MSSFRMRYFAPSHSVLKVALTYLLSEAPKNSRALSRFGLLT